jgi:hypothetical protein
MRNYVDLRKLAEKAINKTGLDIGDPLILAEMTGLKEERKNTETYKASQMTDEQCVSEMVDAANELMKD